MKHPGNGLGFTMMEILIAMVLLSLVAGVMLSSFSSSFKIVQSKDNVAANIARGQLEGFYEFVREDFRLGSNRPISLSSPTFPSGPQPFIPPPLDGVPYTVTYTVTAGPDYNGDGTEDYRRVNMRVSWPP